jgi:alpha-L-arabinofuranosidase
MNALLKFLPILATGAALAQDLVIYSDSLENGWVSKSTATGVNLASTVPLHGGTTAISVSATATSQNFRVQQDIFDSSPYHSLRFWIYPTQSGTNQLSVFGTLNRVTQTATPFKLSFTAGEVNAWKEITIPLASIGIANRADFDGFLIRNTTPGALTFHLDDIRLIGVPVPAQVVLTVNPQDKGRVIDNRIYGLNAVMWDSELSKSISGTLLSTLNTKAIRIPGGSLSDYYDWQRNRSVPNGPSASDFDWASHAATFAKLIENRGAAAYVTVNYGSGTPQQAAAWVAYYNGAPSSTKSLGVDSKGRDWKTVGYWATMRASSPLGSNDGYNFLRIAHPAPFGIKHWEVGNECYGSWEYDQHGLPGSGLSGVPNDPYTYAQAFVSFYNQMLAVDPTLRIGAVSVPGEDSYGNGTNAVPNPNDGNSLHSGWTPVVLANLKALGVTPHFLIIHKYLQRPGYECDAILLQASAEFPAMAADVRKMITDYHGPAGAAVELAITEMNSVSSATGKQTTSLVNGLFMADAICRLAGTEFNACTQWAFRSGSLATGNNSDWLYGRRQYGDYGLVARGERLDTPLNTKFPTYHANELLTRWGRGGDRVIGGTSNYPLLAGYPAQLADGSISLVVINKHPANDLTAQITLTGFTPGTHVGKSYSYGKPNDLSDTGMTVADFNEAASAFNYTFPSYSMTVLVIKSQYAAWRDLAFTPTELADVAVSEDNADPDREGIANLMEYALGLPPKTASTSGLPTVGRQVISGKAYQTLSFTKIRALTDVSYVVEVSDDLDAWAASTARMDDGSTDQAVFRDLVAVEDGPERFIRLRVTRP